MWMKERHYEISGLIFYVVEIFFLHFFESRQNFMSYPPLGSFKRKGERECFKTQKCQKNVLKTFFFVPPMESVPFRK